MVLVDPDRALKASLVITSAERLVVDGDPRTYVHVRIANRSAIDRVRLYAEHAGTRTELPLADASKQRCGVVETCVAITLGPGLPLDAGRIVLSVPELAHEHVAPLPLVELGGYRPTGTALERNTQLGVAIADPIRAHYLEPDHVQVEVDGEVFDQGWTLLFPRDFEAVATPGPCSQAAAPDASGWAAVAGDPFTLPAAFDASDDPWSCASVRPKLPAGGPAVAALSVRSRALVQHYDHEYAPPVEVAPLVFVPLYDLDLGGEARCNEARELVRAALVQAATDIAASDAGGAEVLALDPVDIAESEGVLCRQTNDRTLSGRATADRILAAIDGAFGPARRVRVLLVYATNLNLDLPSGLERELGVLIDALDLDDHRRVAVLALGPERPLAGIHAERTLAWIATDEPSFRGQITEILRTLWPFRTIVHTDQTVVPLVSAADHDRFSRWRLCASSLAVNPLGARVPGTTTLVPPPGGPAYTVELPPVVLAPSATFTLPRVSVSWEGCEGLCDHPEPVAGSERPWSSSPLCP